jgi:hypothetical protein
MASPQSSITYARARLYLGISGVGTGVLLSSAALALDWPAQMAAGGNGLATLWIAYVLLSLPFDLLGGYLLPRRFGRPAPELPAYLAGLVRALLVHAACLGLASVAVLAAGREAGLAGVLTAAALGMALLLIGRPVLAALVGGRRPLTEMAVLRLRAAASNGSRLRGVLVAFGWNLAGVAVAAETTGADLTREEGILTLAFGFSLWSFLGLLLLPSVSRPAVLATDIALLSRGVTRTALETAITQVDRELDDEPVRAKWIERIFHPIPSVAARVAALNKPGAPRWGADEAARLALYLSWASLGLLSRAVHCNSGKPEYWVYLPRD